VESVSKQKGQRGSGFRGYCTRCRPWSSTLHLVWNSPHTQWLDINKELPRVSNYSCEKSLLSWIGLVLFLPHRTFGVSRPGI